jgi:hypothetical protein
MSGAAGTACVIGLSGVRVVGDRVTSSTPLLIGPGMGKAPWGWEEDLQLVPLWCLPPCYATGPGTISFIQKIPAYLPYIIGRVMLACSVCYSIC